MHGIYVRVRHTGTFPAGLLFQDIYPTTDGRVAYRRAGPVYLPVGGEIDMTYTGEVAASFESGSIRGFMDLGYITAEVLFGDNVDGLRTWKGTVGPGGLPTELFIEGEAGHRYVLPDNSACQFEVSIMAVDSSSPTQTAWWDLTGGLTRVGGVTALVGANIGFTQNAGGNAAGWGVTLAAGSDSLLISGTVPASVGPVKFVVNGQLNLVAL